MSTNLLGELSAFGLAIGFSPLHIGLLLLLLLGPKPLQRGGLFVAGWLVTAALAVTLLLTVGHGLLLSMDKGSVHLTGLDLLAAGALPLPLLLAISAGLQVASPDDLFLFAKSASSLLSAGLGRGQELLATGIFSLVSASLLLLPLLALLLAGPERILPLLERGKQWLFAKGDLLVGLVSVVLAVYLGWQGIEGLRLSSAPALLSSLSP